MNGKKELIINILVLFGIWVLGNFIGFSMPLLMIVMICGFGWCIYKIEKTYNNNFTNLDIRNIELTERLSIYEQEIKDLKDQIRFLKNDISNIEHDISPFIRRFDDD